MGRPAKAKRPRRSGQRAIAARYDPPTKRVVVELASGYLVGIPLAELPEIANAPAEQLASVEVIGAGNVLRFGSLDADYSVPALVIAGIGTAATARANGRKGGRPPKRKSAHG